MRIRSTLLRCLIFVGMTALLTGCGIAADGRNNDVNRGEVAKPSVRISIGGSGTNIPVTRKLAEAFMTANPEISVVIPQSLGSAGGIKSVDQGVIDIGLVSREFFPDETRLGLKYLPYAKVPIAFAVNPQVQVDGLTSRQLLDVYSGRINNWSQVGAQGGKIVVLTREVDDSSILVWNNAIKGFKDASLAKTGVMLRTDQAMNEAIASIKSSIGWTDIGSYTIDSLNVRLIKVDGVTPSDETVRSGKYPYFKELAFVVKGEPNRACTEFLNFVQSWQGVNILMENGYLPVEEH